MFECIQHCVYAPASPLDVHAETHQTYVKGIASGYIIGFGNLANLASVFVFERALTTHEENILRIGKVSSPYVYTKWRTLVAADGITVGMITVALLLMAYLIPRTRRAKAKLILQRLSAQKQREMKEVATPPAFFPTYPEGAAIPIMPHSVSSTATTTTTINPAVPL